MTDSDPRPAPTLLASEATAQHTPLMYGLQNINGTVQPTFMVFRRDDGEIAVLYQDNYDRTKPVTCETLNFGEMS